MPRGRFLSRDVSTSERLANLRSDFARLLWTWCIPHADREGRLPGSSRVLRAAVVPMLDVSNEDVSEATADLVRCRLAVLYDSNGTKALQILKFADHQTGMRPDREAPSKYGPPPDLLRTDSGPCSTVENDSAPEDSGPTPEDSREGPPKLSEVKVSQVKVSEGGSGASPAPTPPKRRRKTPVGPMPLGWKPSYTARTRAYDLGLTLGDEATDFQEWTAAKGARYADWDAAFLSHLRRRAQFRKERTGESGAQSEADHEAQKRRIAAEYRAEQARIAREQGEAAPVDLIRKLTAGIGRPVGGGA